MELIELELKLDYPKGIKAFLLKNLKTLKVELSLLDKKFKLN